MAALANAQTRKAPQFVARLHILWLHFTRRSMPATLASELMLKAPDPMSDLFAQAVRENSNLEFDWLWYASQTQSEAEQRYCLARARYINLNSDLLLAKRGSSSAHK